MRWPGLRFSLRTLLLAMAVLPAVGYWFALPTLNAHRFAAALEAEDYAAAEELCADPARAFPGEMKDWLAFQAEARVLPGTWHDWLVGRRPMKIYYRAHVGSTVMQFEGIDCTATHRRIEIAWE